MVGQRMIGVTLVIAAACGHNPPQQSGPGSGDRKSSMQQLTIVIGSARHVLDTGIGRIYRAPVLKVIEGELTDRSIELHVYPNMDGSRYSGHFRSIEEPPSTLRFSLAPEGPVPSEGFWASNGTNWKLVNVDAK